MVYEPIRNTVNIRAKWRQNNYGFRNEEDLVLKGAHELRVFLLGGSAAIGLGSMHEFERITGVGEYPTKYALSDKLREQLALSYPLRDVKVFNAAVSGHRLSHEYALYMTMIRNLQPDLIILVDGYNELSVLTANPPVYVYDVDRESAPHEDTFRSIGALLMSTSYTCFYFGRHFLMSQYSYDEAFFRQCLAASLPVDRNAITQEYGRQEDKVEAQLQDLMARYAVFGETCRIDGVPLLLCPQPLLSLKAHKDDVELACFHHLMEVVDTAEARTSYFDVYLRYLAALGALAQARGLSFLNLQDEVDQTDRGVFIDYCHFSLFGNEYLAQAIARRIRETDLVK